MEDATARLWQRTRSSGSGVWARQSCQSVSQSVRQSVSPSVSQSVSQSPALTAAWPAHTCSAQWQAREMEVSRSVVCNRGESGRGKRPTRPGDTSPGRQANSDRPRFLALPTLHALARKPPATSSGELRAALLLLLLMHSAPGQGAWNARPPSYIYPSTLSRPHHRLANSTTHTYCLAPPIHAHPHIHIHPQLQPNRNPTTTQPQLSHNYITHPLTPCPPTLDTTTRCPQRLPSAPDQAADDRL